MKLVRKTTVWMPTFSGFLLIFLLLGLFGFGFCSQLYPFLALSRPLPQPELVIIEGWLGDVELAALYERFEPGTRFVTTGGPVKYGQSLLKEKTYAAVTAVRLRQFGAPEASVLAAPADDVACDRTYASARAVRKILEEKGLFGRPANLYSTGAHSRRSFFLYRRAFGQEVPLGVVSVDSEEYDLRHWWRSSLAFKHVINEWISWLYTQCTFWKY